MQRRFNYAMDKKDYNADDVTAARAYVQAEPGFVLYAHGLYANMTGVGEYGEEEKSKHGRKH